MPILRGDHERENRLQLVRDGNHRVPIGDGERATGQEVVLDIYED
jgi:hypothetical protein